MANKISATVTFGYDDTDSTRNYKFDNLTEEQLEGIKDRALAFNVDLADEESEEAAQIKEFFLDETGEHQLKGIVALKSDEIEETNIKLY